jgi:hypothetical protein
MKTIETQFDSKEWSKLVTALRTAVDKMEHWTKKQHHITIYLTPLD